MCGRLKISTNIFEGDGVTVLDLAHEKECHSAAVIKGMPKLFFLSSSCCLNLTLSVESSSSTEIDQQQGHPLTVSP